MEIHITRVYSTTGINTEQNTIGLLTSENNKEKYLNIDDSTQGVSFEVEIHNGLKIYRKRGWNTFIVEKTYKTDPQTTTFKDYTNFCTEKDEEIDRLILRDSKFFPLWSAHWLILEENEKNKNKSLIKSWLENTINSNNSDNIINGDTNHSITWLRYVIITNGHDKEFYLNTLRIAQLFYSEYDQLNTELLKLISLTKSNKKDLIKLKKIKLNIDLIGIYLGEVRRHISRDSKTLLDSILKCWEFKDLANDIGELYRISGSIIDEKNNSKIIISRYATELILVFIGLISIIDLSLSWVFLGRQIAIDPNLLFMDDAIPWFVSVVLNNSLDFFINSTFIFVIIVAGVYVYFKGRNSN